jgi:hypothetical protein
MSLEFDPSEFVDTDYQAALKAARAGGGATASLAAEPGRAPTREEVEARVSDMQSRLADLKRTQAELERERSSLEELRRRQVELTTGRAEMLQSLTRGVGLLEEAEFATRRDAEQMARVLADLRDALVKVQSVQQESWTKDNLNVELTRASTLVENARMEWNSARMKFPLLDGAAPAPTPAAVAVAGVPDTPAGLAAVLQQQSYARLCKLGLALTWPIALAVLMLIVALLLRA